MHGPYSGLNHRQVNECVFKYSNDEPLLQNIRPSEQPPGKLQIRSNDLSSLIYEFFFQGSFRSVYKPQNYKAQNGFCELSCPHLFTWPKSFLDISKPKLKVKFLHLCTKGCSGVVKIFHILIVMVFTPQLWKLTNHLKSVHFIVCKLCLNKINLRKT